MKICWKDCTWLPYRAFPTDAEKTKILPELAATSAADKRQAVEDLYWSVLSSTEFLFNH